jgi:hypothetical protein
MHENKSDINQGIDSGEISMITVGLREATVQRYSGIKFSHLEDERKRRLESYQDRRLISQEDKNTSKKSPCATNPSAQDLKPP